MGIRGLAFTRKILVILKHRNNAVCRMSTVPALGKSIYGASMGGLREASKSPSVMQTVSAHSPFAGRKPRHSEGQHLPPKLGSLPSGLWKLGPRIGTARLSQERNTHTWALPCPTRPLRLRQQTLAAALLRVRVAGPPPTPVPCSAPSRRTRSRRPKRRRCGALWWPPRA